MIRYSIVVPTYNSAATLARLLESLAAQTYGDFEVIVVDDASTDQTAALFEGSPFRYECLPRNSGPAFARNHGVKLAQGEWLVFTDADTEFAPHTLADIDTLLAQCPAADALVGSYAGKPANRGFVPRYKALWEYCTIDLAVQADALGMEPYPVWAPRPGLVRKAAFEAIGGFDTRFRGADLEDMELGYRLVEAGYRIFIAPKIRIRHHYPPTAKRELTAFARRAAIWMRLRKKDRKLDSRGEGSPQTALAHFVGFGAFWLALFGWVWPPLYSVAALALLLYMALNRLFLVQALREGGLIFALRCAGYCWVHTIVLGFAAAYGLATPPRGTA